MNRNLKLTLMFAPLALAFAGFAVIVQDIRHPRLTQDHCIVTATGNDVKAYRSAGHYIYRQSENPQQDVSLRCERYGTLLLNDLQLMQTPIKSGQDAYIRHKGFQYFPERWEVSVHTGPNEK